MKGAREFGKNCYRTNATITDVFGPVTTDFCCTEVQNIVHWKNDVHNAVFYNEIPESENAFLHIRLTMSGET